MEYGLYEKCIDDLAQFPEKVKTLRFVGMGEPLLHKDITKMIKRAKEARIANTIELLTNGSLLTHRMSDELIAAGLDRLVISLQGTSAGKYRDISGIELDFQEFVENIRYFYEHKTDTQMYLKIVDIALTAKKTEKDTWICLGTYATRSVLKIRCRYFRMSHLTTNCTKRRI